MSNDDLDFSALMAGEGVEPLKRDARAELESHHEKRGEIDYEARRRAATDGEEEGLSTRYCQLVDPNDPLEWKRDGVQEGVYRNLRLGKYQVDARLDLFKKTVPQTRDELLAFIDECMKFGIRTVLVSHGRGKHKQAHGNVLKSFLNDWLPQIPHVMAYHSAQKQHGGLSAIYILLRKSEEERLANWEQHQKR